MNCFNSISSLLRIVLTKPIEASFKMTHEFLNEQGITFFCWIYMQEESSIHLFSELETLPNPSLILLVICANGKWLDLILRLIWPNKFSKGNALKESSEPSLRQSLTMWDSICKLYTTCLLYTSDAADE